MKGGVSGVEGSEGPAVWRGLVDSISVEALETAEDTLYII